MNKKIKLIIIIFLGIFLTGCSIKYDLTVTSTKKVIEKVSVSANRQGLTNMSNGKLKNRVEEEIKNLKKSSFYKTYKIDYKIHDNDNFTLNFNKAYKDLTTFKNSSTYKNLFEDIYIEENESKIKVATSGQFTNPNMGENPDPNFFVRDIEINIRFHNKVDSSNADKVDEKSNTHTWLVKSDDMSKKISFELSNEVRYDIIIIDFIFNNLLTLILFGGVIITLLIVLSYFYIVNRKNNSI